MRTRPSLEWIESNGGPLIALPAAALAHWGGVTRGAPTDYERACGIADYLGVLPVVSMEALVLGDEPLPTAWLPQDGGGILARWVYGPSDAAVAAALVALPVNLPSESVLVWRVAASPVIVLDSAEDGEPPFGPRLTLELVPGRYHVTTSSYRPSDEIALVVHRLMLVELATAAS